MSVLLASSSPQRREILAKLGISFEARDPAVSELRGGDPEAEVVENARRKAGAVEGQGLILACDTDVVLDGVALGKPADQAQAERYLRSLSGRTHQVLSGLVVKAGEERSGLERTSVTFRHLGEVEIERYLRFGEWRGRSGGYAIQTLGSTLIERVEGSISNVIGLPVGLLLRLAPELFERN